jgi:hypothetical protein
MMAEPSRTDQVWARQQVRTVPPSSPGLPELLQVLVLHSEMPAWPMSAQVWVASQ